ncbi:hypothetical protein Ddye_024869 [Dipteronia dyeriana]|uniref:Uncharacterized protein n=1 Tax=Dipteronia dyeriana TaxID=168575 RepID=A0AAD9TVS1_9ROSI|nr:hypothetical protein Ddye_024869 [Dipteronia dyeriana]
MQVPIGTIMGSLLENYMLGSGSLGRIYGSIITLSSSYLQPYVSKDVVLTPKLSSSSTIDSALLLRNFVSKKRKCESSYDQYGIYGSAKAAKVYPSSSKRGDTTSSKEEQGFVRASLMAEEPSWTSGVLQYLCCGHYAYVNM